MWAFVRWLAEYLLTKREIAIVGRQLEKGALTKSMKRAMTRKAQLGAKNKMFSYWINWETMSIDLRFNIKNYFKRQVSKRIPFWKFKQVVGLFKTPELRKAILKRVGHYEVSKGLRRVGTPVFAVWYLFNRERYQYMTQTFMKMKEKELTPEQEKMLAKRFKIIVKRDRENLKKCASRVNWEQSAFAVYSTLQDMDFHKNLTKYLNDTFNSENVSKREKIWCMLCYNQFKEQLPEVQPFCLVRPSSPLTQNFFNRGVYFFNSQVMRLAIRSGWNRTHYIKEYDFQAVGIDLATETVRTFDFGGNIYHNYYVERLRKKLYVLPKKEKKKEFWLFRTHKAHFTKKGRK